MLQTFQSVPIVAVYGSRDPSQDSGAAGAEHCTVDWLQLSLLQAGLIFGTMPSRTGCTRILFSRGGILT